MPGRGRSVLPACSIALCLVGALSVHIAWTGQTAAEPGVFELRVPELALTVGANGNAILPRRDVTQLEIGIRKTGIDFGAIHSKINTESADIIMTTLARRDEIVCRFDLGLRSGFMLSAGRNTVEISFEDRRGRLYYGSFLLKDATSKPYRPALAPAAPLGTQGEKFAVVIGVSRYANRSSQLPDLEFAARDAHAFREFLTQANGGGFQPANIRFLVDERATLKNIRTALFTFLTRPKAEDLVVIYYAGHGLPDPNDPRQLYLLAHDSEFQNMGGTALLMSDFQDVFGRILKSKRVITFADACHSEGISGGIPGAGNDLNNLINQYLARISGLGRRAVITASDIGELSYESARWGSGHGVFTYYLLKGLKGEADLNSDGTVVAGELFQYVQREVRGETAGNQNPAVVGGLAEGLALAGLGARRSASLFPSQLGGGPIAAIARFHATLLRPVFQFQETERSYPSDSR